MSADLQLRPFQREAVDWLSWRDRALLADDQGLGKTISAIVAADRVHADRLLVIAPTVVAWNWARELQTWSPWRTVQVVSKGRDVVDRRADAVIVPHGLLLAPFVQAQLLDHRHRWPLIVLDEAHHFRSPTAKRTRIFYGHWGQELATSQAVAGNADRVWLLTGTPAPNDPSELWAPLWGLWRETVHWSHQAFQSRFCKLKPTDYGVKVIGTRNEAELAALLQPRMLRRLKANVLHELPPVQWSTVALSPSSVSQELRRLELKLPRALVDELRRSDDPTAVLSALRAQEAIGVWRRLCGEAKARAGAELLAEELADGRTEALVLFAHHRSVLDVLCASLARFGVLRIDGSTSATARQAAVEAFQRPGGPRVMVANLLAAGVGITLTRACEVAFVELDWVPGNNAQATDRVHRIGQTRPVRARFLTLANSIDELVVDALRHKVAMVSRVLNQQVPQ